MKKPAKNQENKFICEECHHLYKRFCDLSKHIGLKHNSKIYYDKNLKEDNEEICPICGNENLYLDRWDRGYKKTCSKSCEYILAKQTSKKTCLKRYGNEHYNNTFQIQKTCLERYGNVCAAQSEKNQVIIKQNLIKKYGVDNPLKSEEIQKKCRKTMKEKYGVEYCMQSPEIVEKIKKTNIERYGVEYPVQNSEIHDKIKKSTKKSTGFEYNFQNKELMENSLMKKYGVTNSFQSPAVQKLCRKVMKEKYGVEYSMQNIDIFEKGQKTRFLRKQFKDTDIWYQGSYELDFLEKFYQKYNIQRGPTIKYILDDKQKVYYPDFYIPSLNLIIECKNKYLLKKYKILCNLKKKAAIAAGFNYIMIVDKNYSFLS